VILSNYNRAHSVVSVPALIEALGQGLSLRRTAKLLGYSNTMALRAYMTSRLVDRHIINGVTVVKRMRAAAKEIA
jgi:hypothetical protein